MSEIEFDFAAPGEDEKVADPGLPETVELAEGDIITGVYRGTRRAGDTGNLLDIAPAGVKRADGSAETYHACSIWEKASLGRQMKAVPDGAHVWIMCQGKHENERGFPEWQFDVRTRKKGGSFGFKRS